jgi:ABC-type multidrug transport system fused ATPase/permease subunit
MEALGRLMKGRTSVVIAHRLGTVRHADVIFVIKDCALAEQGTHDTLMARNGVYAELHTIQTPDDATMDPARSAAVSA